MPVTAPATPKYCTDCFYARNRYSGTEAGWTCAAPSNTLREISLITGSAKLYWPSCLDARKNYQVNETSCGREAKWFKSRAEALQLFRSTSASPSAVKKATLNIEDL